MITEIGDRGYLQLNNIRIIIDKLESAQEKRRTLKVYGKWKLFIDAVLEGDKNSAKKD